mgnify:FL=1
MDYEKTQADIDKGRKAEELLENELLKEALTAIEKEINDQWLACPARDKEGKEALWQLAKTIEKFRNILTGYVESGKLATDQFARFEKESKLRSFLKMA